MKLFHVMVYPSTKEKPSSLLVRAESTEEAARLFCRSALSSRSPREVREMYQDIWFKVTSAVPGDANGPSRDA